MLDETSKIMIPNEVIELAKNIGTKIEFVRNVDGYDVYSVYTPSEDFPTPTGLPDVIIYKEGKAKWICGVESFDWLGD